MRRILSWAKTHRILAGITAFLAVSIVVGAINSGTGKTANTAAASAPNTPAVSAPVPSTPAGSATPSPTHVAAKTSPAAPTTHPVSATTEAAAAPAPASPEASPSCNLPDNQDLIERDDDPGAQVLAQELGEADLGNCTATLDTFVQEAGQASGECTTIAWASDNPGYDVNAIPAPPLKYVIESAGPGC